MDNLVYEQCRTCLKKTNTAISLSAHHLVCGKVTSVIDLLKFCTSAKIDIDDGYPQHICLYCTRQAKGAFEFRLQCEKADKSLRNSLQNDESYGTQERAGSEISTHTFNSDDDLECDEYETETAIQTEDLILEEEFTCLVCNLNFPTAAGLARHSSRHDQIFYECPECSVRFISQELLDNHISCKHETILRGRRARRKKLEFNCEICSKKFMSENSLRKHLKKHLTEENIEYLEINEYQCKVCPEKFETLADYDTHLKTHPEESELSEDVRPVSYSCKYCEDEFDNASEFQSHLEQHLDRKQNDMQNKVTYKCKVCFDEVATLSDMKTHLSTHDVGSQEIFQHLLYKCSECESEFETIYDYFGHVPKHSGGVVENCPEGGVRIVRKRPYKCLVADCNKTFPTPSALRNHTRSHQSRWPKKCRHCELVVYKWHDYMTHLNEQHDDMKTFICSQCGKKFFKERNLDRHAKTHSGERNFMCDICGFSFHAQNNLVAHRRLHTGSKPYKCTFCPKAFSQHAGLRSHLLNHVGERIHECPTCNRKFLRPGSLKNHMKTHTGAKDYACHICGARFGASSTRKKHLLIHTGERNHICDICGKAFSRRSNLIVHRKIHTGEASHVCEICGKGFIQAHVLRTHMNTHRKRAALEESKRAEIDEKYSETPLEQKIFIELIE